MAQPVQYTRPIQQVRPNLPRKESKIKEALVGKYLIGALASLLVFVGAISLIGLVWNDLTPEIKLTLISLIGLLLTGLGFWLIRTKKNPITSIILGTGAGLLFIGILAANMSFHLIGNNTSIILACIWAIFFILSSRYTNLFFTTIIAYIGSFIALILGLCLLNGDIELFIMVLFASAISGVMIYNAFRNKNRTELLISILLSFLSYVTISIRTFFDGLLLSKQLLHSYLIQSIVIVIIYVLLNLIYYLKDHKKGFPWYLGFSFITSMVTVLYITNLSENYLHFDKLTCFILFFVINAIQMLFSNFIFKNIYKTLTVYYTLTLVAASMFINIELIDFPTGIIIVGLILAFIDITFRRNSFPILISFIALLDSLFLAANDSSFLICLVYGILQLMLISYLLYKEYHLKEFEYIDLIKVIGMVIIVLNSFSLPKNVARFLINQYNLEFTGNTIAYMLGYLLAVSCFVFTMKLGYFKNWNDEKFKFLQSNNEVMTNSNMKTLFYMASSVLYFLGLHGIDTSGIWYEQLIFTASTIVIALIQTRNLIKNKNKKAIVSEIWIGVKYLILIWVILNSYFDLRINSVMYSITGLIISIGSISLGFQFRLKNLRLYGLILTILMVAKFILIDLSQENSITRVIALIFGGLICFAISVIYNKLNNKIENE